MSYLQIYFIIGLITAVINIMACATIYKELQGLHILVSLFITMPFWPVIWLKGFSKITFWKSKDKKDTRGRLKNGGILRNKRRYLNHGQQGFFLITSEPCSAWRRRTSENCELSMFKILLY